MRRSFFTQRPVPWENGSPNDEGIYAFDIIP